MNISVIILFLSLMVRDVFTIRGLYSAEVEILPEGQIPAATDDEITCTIATIEPAGMDVNFVKYIASPEEASMGPCILQDNSASTFEDCADAAASLGSVPNTTQEGQFCNTTRTTICKDGRLVNDIITNGEVCTDNIAALATFEGLYHLMASGKSIPIEDHYDECAKHGALPCAPPVDASLSDFIEHMKEINNDVSYFAIGLNSSDSGSTFEWATGVAMPDTHVGWINGQKPTPVAGYICAYFGVGEITPYTCSFRNRFCCMVPYFAD